MPPRGLPTGHTNLYYRANSYINSLSMYQAPLEVIRSVIDCVSSGTSSCEQINEVYDQFLSGTARQSVLNINSCVEENISRITVYRDNL